MKHFLIASILFFSCIAYSGNNERMADSEIDEVTVFLQGAQINRTGNVTVPEGQSEIIFTGISPLLKRESLQAGSKSSITILSVHYETKLTEKKQDLDELKDLESKRNQLYKKITRLNAKLEVIQIQENMITNLSNVQQTMKDFKIDDVVKAKEIIATQLEQIKLQKIDVQEQINTINNELNEINQKIQAFGVVYSSIEPRVIVKVKSSREQKVKMNISYFVPNARWYPSYNLRVKDVKSPLVIDYQANISQQTGEDWSNVNLTLSTHDPNLSGQKPILSPWYLVLNQYNQRQNNSNQNRYTPNQYTHVKGRLTDMYGEPLPYANVSVIGTTVGTVTDVDGYYSLNLPTGATQLQFSYIGYNTVNIYVQANEHNVVMSEKALSIEEVTVLDDFEVYDAPESVQTMDVAYTMSSNETLTISAYEQKKGKRSNNGSYKTGATQSVPVQVEKIENVVSAEFKIKEAYSIPSNNRSYMVQIDEIEQKAHYQYYCAPKLDPDAFLTAQVLDWEELNLLEGQANVFFEGTYVGTSLLDAKFVGDTLDISLGRDKRVVVQRTKEKEVSKKKVIGDDEVKTVKWNIEVKNQKSQSINLILEDQFPLTTDTRIKIEKDDVSKAKVDENTGYITWNLELRGGKSEKVAFKYKVTYPKGNTVYLD